MSDRRLFSSYAGLGRVAMVYGIPLMPALIVCSLAVMAGMIGGFLFGPGGFCLAVPAIPVLLFFRKLCATDDQALRVLGFELMCFLGRSNARLFGGTYTLAPVKYGLRLDVYRRAFQRTPERALYERFRHDFTIQKDQ